jgi:RHS repeat-associated protein
VNGVAMALTAGRLAEQYTVTQGAGCTAAKITDEGFSYDADGRTTDVYESTPHSGTSYYHSTVAYWANGVLQSLSGIPGYPVMSYGVDGEGRLSSALQGTKDIVCDSTCSALSTTYNAASQASIVNIGGTGNSGAGDSDTYTYDSTGRMSGYTFTVGSTPESMSGMLTWNPNGSLRQLAITDGFDSGGTQTCTYGTSTVMGYDDLGRLLSANCGSVWQQTFSYDQYDNITKSGSLSWACSACYNASTNQYNSSLSAKISYDPNGNLLNDTFHQYSWDAYGHPVTIGPATGTVTCGDSDVTCVIYDAIGRAVEKNVAGVYTQILYSPVGKTAIMSAQTTSDAYVPLPGGETLFLSGSTGGNRFFFHKDWLGTVRLSTNVSSRALVYDRGFAPYGEMYDNFGTTTQLDFTGDTQDTVSGTFDTPNRELNPSQGRWLSPDPARAGWNLYAYSTDPNTGTDPTGLYIASSNSDFEGLLEWNAMWAGRGTKPTTAPDDAIGASSSSLFPHVNIDYPVYWVRSAATASDFNDTSSNPQGGQPCQQAENQRANVQGSIQLESTGDWVQDMKNAVDYMIAVAYLRQSAVMEGVVDTFEQGLTTIDFIHNGNDAYSHERDTLYWDPRSALETTSGDTQSPALGLGHEMAHANGGDNADMLKTMFDMQYENKEERRVITEYETPAARQLGEGIREDHSAKSLFNVPVPTMRNPIP